MYIIGMGCVSSLGRGMDSLKAVIDFCDPRAPQKVFSKLESLSNTVFYQGDISDQHAESCLELANIACTDALLDSGLNGEPLNIALVIASGAGETRYTEYNLDKSPYQLAQELAEKIGITGVYTTVSNACSSAGYALSVAEDLAESHDAVLLCGVEAKSYASQATFKSLLILDDVSCRPFSESRNGTVFGCGAAALVMTKQNQLYKRPYARITATALTCDAYHTTSPHPEGTEMRRCINEALKKSGMNSEDISIFVPHATGTKLNDTIEIDLLSDIFRENFNPQTALLVKKYIGHTGGASTAFSLIVAVLELAKQTDAGVRNKGALVASTAFGGHNSGTLLKSSNLDHMSSL